MSTHKGGLPNPTREKYTHSGAHWKTTPNARKTDGWEGGELGVGAHTPPGKKETTKRCTSPTSTPTNSTSTTQGEAQPPTHSHRTHPSTHENTHAPLLPRAHQNCNSGTHKEHNAAHTHPKRRHRLTLPPMQRRHVPLPQKNSSGGTHRRTTRGERGALHGQVGAHTPTRKNKASKNPEERQD